jgi:hypothetical protein
MYKYELPYRNAAGHIFPDDTDAVDLMLIAVEKHPEIHIVTHLTKDANYLILNRYESHNARVHYLMTGNADPEIQSTQEVSLEDTFEEDHEGWEKFLEEFRTAEYTPVQIAAINFAMNSMLKKS